MPDQPMTIEQFGASIKAKYPDYANYSDQEIGQRMLEKYPQYKDRVQAPTPYQGMNVLAEGRRSAAQSGQPEGVSPDLAQAMGPLAHPQTLTDFANLLTLPVDTVRKAWIGAMTAAASRGPAATTLTKSGEALEALGNSGAAKSMEHAAPFEAIYKGDWKGAVATAIPSVLRGTGRGLQWAGNALEEKPPAPATFSVPQQAATSPAGTPSAAPGPTAPPASAPAVPAPGPYPGGPRTFYAGPGEGPTPPLKVLEGLKKAGYDDSMIAESAQLLKRGMSPADVVKRMEAARALQQSGSFSKLPTTLEAVERVGMRNADPNGKWPE